MTTTALLLLLSAALIAAGVALIWRDVHRSRREAFLPRGSRPAAASADPELEVTVARRAAEPPPRRPAASAASLSASLQGSAPPPPPSPPSAPDAAPQWAPLQPVLTQAVERVNAVLAAAGVAIGAAGEPSWSINRRYGAYRRILLRGESVAWLRLEIDTAGQLQAAVKAHKDDLAAINATANAAAHGLTVAGASDLLSECLKPAASLAMRAAGGGNTEQWASETAWKAVDPVVVAALKAANGALAQAGARFVPVGTPAWVPDLRRHRLTVTVEVLDAEAARMHIERVGEEMEVAVGVPDARLAHLARRQRLPVAGLTTHALAEMIAGSTWPAIAHIREGAAGP
jgi:hypothetical protein